MEREFLDALSTGVAIDGSSRVGDACWLDRRERREDCAAWCARSERGVIATANYQATAAGAAMFARGGNAIDAAVAAAFALGVVEPAGSGLGGMAIAVVAPAGRPPVTVEGGCLAPRRATPERVNSSPSRYRGYGAVAVPMQVAVMEQLLREHGTLPEHTVLAPAIELAAGGCRVTPVLHALVGQYGPALVQDRIREVFLDEDGTSLPIGATLRQPALAATLRRLATAGLRDFYSGDVAARIADDMRRNDGFVDAEDLGEARPHVAEPIVVPYRGGCAAVAGPPAGGLALAQMLRVVDRLGGIDLDTTAGIALCARLIRRARQDRRRVRKEIGARELAGAARLLADHDVDAVLADIDGETSHISAMDSAGNAVGVTQSVERSFGAAVVGEDLGFVYNGYLRGFKLQAEGHPHYLRPGTPARSNAAPTIFSDAGGPVAVIGSTGSERMASGILTTVLHLASRDPFRAVQAPRFHCTPEGQLMIENRGDVRSGDLAGFEVHELDDYAFAMGGLQLAIRDGVELVAVADPRRDGAAAGAAPDDQDLREAD